MRVIACDQTQTTTVGPLRGKYIAVILKNAYEDVILKFIEAEEPLATLCHGDSTINNTLLKNENGKLKTMFIDFALIRYGSLILDLKLFNL